MKNLVLVGFMGSGKTSAGKLAAQQLGLAFVDMDAIIEDRLGQAIAEIFATRGEPYFRERERELAQELAARDGHVIATGGGVVLNPDNIRVLSQTGIVVCCWVDPRVVFERTRHTKHRPLLETDADRQARIAALLRQREPLYRAIPLQLDTSAMTVAQQADALVRIYQEQSARARL
jgi:shikimate kinase